MQKLPIIIGILSLLPRLVLASGLSVSPARLDFEVNDETKASKSLIVSNPTADVLIFEIYADEFAGIISAKPESFTLEAGGRKEVVINANAKNITNSPSSLFGQPFGPELMVEGRGGKGGVVSTNISVVGKALAEGKINLASGAKIPITITISPSVAAKPFYAQYSLIILLVLTICLLLARKKWRI